MKMMMNAVWKRWPLAAIALVMATIGVLAEINGPVWITKRSVIEWDAPADPIRVGWNMTLTTIAVTNLPASDFERGTAPTNGIARWLIILDGTTNRLNASLMLQGVPSSFGSGNLKLWCSARDRDGRYSDWIQLGVIDGTPANLRLK